MPHDGRHNGTQGVLVFRMILGQLRQRMSRAIALVVGILVATTGFTVLTANTSAARLQATATVANANARSPYDILVRPAGSASADEQADAVLPPNFLSGQYGGITRDEWHAIERIPGIAVAAPIAMFGYVAVSIQRDVDITDEIDRTATTQVLQMDTSWQVDRGLSTLADPGIQFVYVTRRPVAWPTVDVDSGQLEWSDGKSRPGKSRCEGEFNAAAIEIEPDGTERALCRNNSFHEGYDQSAHPQLVVAQLLPDGTFRTSFADSSARLTVSVGTPMYLLLAGVDPDAEARLVGLDRAVVAGQYLSSAPIPTPLHPDSEALNVPVLATTKPDIDEQLSVSVSRVGVPSDADIGGPGWVQEPPVLAPELQAAARERLSSETFTAASEYDRLLATVAGSADPRLSYLIGLVQAGPPTVSRAADGALVPTPVDPPDPLKVEPDVSSTGRLLPPFLTDTAFRELTPVDASRIGSVRYRVTLNLTGTFDPARLTDFSDLAGAPLETYRSPDLAGADAASRDVLGDQPLAPDSNPAGYLSSPPMLLTSLAAPIFTKAPISAIRVRVAGVTGVDGVSRERVRLAAERIRAATGLDVDITVGSSLVPRTVELAPGQYGRPALRLTEWWTKKGVAVSIISAVDRKSVVLYGLILVVCVLFLANGVSAALRDRRQELAILACLGWPRRRIASLVAGEVALVGLVAGMVSAALALPVGRLAGVSFGALHAVYAVPVALGLTILATVVPLLRATQARPGAALSPSVVAPRLRWHGRWRTVAGMALANLWRTPGRTLVAGIGLAIGIAAVTVLTSVTWAFHGAITGSLLGDAVSLQVRGVDAVAVGATVVLGLVAVADVLYLNVRDRAAEFAALRAVGWSDGALARLVTYEGLGMGALAAIVGAAAGLGGAAAFAGSLGQDQIWLAAASALGGALAAGAAAIVPAMLQRRLPISALLAEDM
ncbi:MAG TPA: FtsX-like permease family protein [Micromonosporaceae bacterium]|jgi:hypothetical protein